MHRAETIAAIDIVHDQRKGLRACRGVGPRHGRRNVVAVAGAGTAQIRPRIFVRPEVAILEGGRCDGERRVSSFADLQAHGRSFFIADEQFALHQGRGSPGGAAVGARDDRGAHPHPAAEPL